MWYLCTVKYCSALKGREILTPAPTWINLKDIMLNEKGQLQKDKYCVIPRVNSYRSKVERWLPGAVGRG